ncbi:MAG: endonuclease MutS2 [Anaeroplasma sp.]
MKYDYKTLEFNKIIELLKDYAKTDYAKECIENFEIPNNLDEIIVLGKETKQAFDCIVKLSDIPLGGLYSIKDSLKLALAGGTLQTNELLNVVGLLDCSTNVIKYFKQINDIKIETNELTKYTNNLKISNTLKTNITLAISSDGRILDNASRELFMIRRSLKSLENRLRSKLNELLTTKASMLTEQLIVQRDGRMCLPVKIEHKNTFKGIIHDVSASNTTVYIEPESTLETSNQIESYLAQEKKEIQTILKNLSLLVGSEADDLINNVEMLTKLDIIFAKALMSKENDYNEAKIENSQYFNLKKAKHPLIDKAICVPIDIELGKTHTAIIITGPNTGGKTVALKTVGILHLMAYYGLMVPVASDSIFGYFNSIAADIGDEQSIEQSLSTFSSHMTKIVGIINDISFDSLVLLDELGSGTDPKEGSSLAIAIIDYLKNAGARIICTTHYSELKNYAFRQNDILNASVEFNTNTLKPTYRLLLGVPGKSNAIEISLRLGLNEKIIESSKKELNSMSSESQELIGNLEEEMTKLRNKETTLEHKIKQYEVMLDELKTEKFELAKKSDKFIADAKREASKILSEAKEEAQKLIDEIKNLSDENFKEHELAELKRKTRNLDVKETEANDFDMVELKEGDYVYVKSYEKYGTISKIKKDKYSVNIGQFSMDFKRNELMPATKPVQKKKKETRLSGYNPASHVGLSLDLRGKRYEEVNYLMDQYLDQAILGNLDCVTIIHGFGTGAIRNAVQDYLKKCPYAKSYRYGKEGEGLNGVTVVYLK